jgi:hypothetical protein
VNIIKQSLPNGMAYKTYDGWDVFNKGQPLDLSNVQRFTDGERELIKLERNQEWQHFGCYKEL